MPKPADTMGTDQRPEYHIFLPNVLPWSQTTVATRCDQIAALCPEVWEAQVAATTPISCHVSWTSHALPEKTSLALIEWTFSIVKSHKAPVLIVNLK